MRKRIQVIFLSFLLVYGVFGCSEHDDINSRIDKLEEKVDALSDAVSALRNAIESGKVIKSVEALSHDGNGWLITFSDNSTIRIDNGKDGEKGEDGLTPYFSADLEGYLCVSYDNETKTKIVDENGDFVKVKGADGKSGKSTSVVITESNYYAIVNETVSDNGSLQTDTIYTAFTADKSSIISSIYEEVQSHSLTIVMADGTEYTFSKEYSTPTGIVLLYNKDVDLSEGTSFSFEFRVNPSNALFNYDVESDSCSIVLDKVGSNKSGSYVTAPTNYRLSSVERVYDDQGVLKVGQYRATIEDLKISDSYKDVAALVLSVKNDVGEDIQISSSIFNVNYVDNVIKTFKFELSKNPSKIIEDIDVLIDGDKIKLFSPKIFDLTGLVPTIETNAKYVFANDVQQVLGVSPVDFSKPVEYSVVSADGDRRTYKVEISNTGLPLVVINTEDNKPIVSKDDWLVNTSITIYNTDGSIEYQGHTDNIKGRGNSTWNAPKKPYAIKLDKKAEIFGFPKHKRWVLLANWRDRTVLRNDVTFELGNRTGLEWTPRGKHVEVILNGKHLGNYFFCEQVKIDKNRVNVNELTAEDTDEDIIKGGYLMELDVYYDEVNKFKSAVKKLPYMFKEPDEEILNDAQFSFMRDYVNRFETALYDDEEFANRTYAEYIDVDSYIDFYLVNEVVGNAELNNPKSTYMHKDKDGMLTAGPLWDFDTYTFVPKRSSRYVIKNCLYYTRFDEDPEYIERVKERWSELYPKFVAIGAYIDEKAELLRKSQEVNIKLWPINVRYNEDETLSFDEAVSTMKSAVLTKIEWLNNKINSL